MLATLDQWQASLGYSDAGMARFLGRDNSEWSHMRSRRRRPTFGLLRIALKRAPEPWRSALEKAHLADLAADEAGACDGR